RNHRPAARTLCVGMGLFIVGGRHYRWELANSVGSSYPVSAPAGSSFPTPPLDREGFCFAMTVNKTYSPKPGDITREWWLVDATDLPLGRPASEVAKILRSAEHTPEIQSRANLVC